jgi:hypothetical protein
MSSKTISTEIITGKILFIRGQKVMLDKDLAQLYRVKPIRLREQVKRNRRRFPDDFMFQLTHEEADSMVSQNAIPSRKHLGGYRPYVFTEQGVAMLSTVLNSERAIFVNIAIMRAFVKLREALSLNKELAAKLKELERKVEGHDESIHAIFEAIRRLMREEEKPKGKIGFHP